MKFYCSLFLVTLVLVGHAQTEDQFLWLENIDDEKALDWVRNLNDKSTEVLKEQESYQAMYLKNLEIYNSDERIAEPEIIKDYIYNLWKDDKNERGIWRRAKLESYMSDAPVWETLIDIDQLSTEEDTKWVFKGSVGLYPDYKKFMISLSKGGGDAVVNREFDMETRSFVENGFETPNSKGSVSWIDENTMIASKDFGEGTLTTSGYPNQVRVWERGSEIDSAEIVFEGSIDDVGSWGYVLPTREKNFQMVIRAITFYTSETYVREGEEFIKLEIPLDADFHGIMAGQLIVELKSDWEVEDNLYRQGSVLSIDYDQFIEGSRSFVEIVVPGERSTVNTLLTTKNYLLVDMLNNIKSELYIYSFDSSGWTNRRVDAPKLGSIKIGSTSDYSDKFFYYYTDFMYPSTLYYADAKSGESEVIQSLPNFFDAEKFESNQYEATSKDGTKIPYFVVSSKEMKLNGTNPTLLYAYGGFEISKKPFYSATVGTNWLEKGGVFVLANIRGGGEFGPKWHQAGLKENRQRVYDDFAAVAEDLIDKGITSSKNLGIMGGSNGGLLVGVAFTQRPDLYNAVVCQVPLLDMKRYNKLLAGASWMGEYGNPDIPEEWEYISQYSPYHNLKEDIDYPKVLFTTSTRDDRVHPGHARKMAAKMLDMGHDIMYYENIEGGHGGVSTNDQKAKLNALIYSYLWMQLDEIGSKSDQLIDR